MRRGQVSVECLSGNERVRFAFHGHCVQAAIAIEDLSAGNGGHTIAGNDDADQIDGVSGGDRDDGSAVADTGGAKGLQGFRKGVLLAAEAGEETATTNLAACFEAAKNVQEIAPFRSVGFAGEEVAEENSIASEKLTRKGFQRGVGAAGLFYCGWSCVKFLAKKGPAAGSVTRWSFTMGFGSGGFAAWIHAGAELVEAVCGGKPCGSKLPKGVLSLLTGEVGDALDVVGEAGSALLEEST